MRPAEHWPRGAYGQARLDRSRSERLFEIQDPLGTVQPLAGVVARWVKEAHQFLRLGDARFPRIQTIIAQSCILSKTPEPRNRPAMTRRPRKQYNYFCAIVSERAVAYGRAHPPTLESRLSSAMRAEVNAVTDRGWVAPNKPVAGATSPDEPGQRDGSVATWRSGGGDDARTH